MSKITFERSPSVIFKDGISKIAPSPLCFGEPLLADGKSCLGPTTFCRHWIKCLYWSWNSVVDKNLYFELSAKNFDVSMYKYYFMGIKYGILCINLISSIAPVNIFHVTESDSWRRR